mmetsp:Transcript_2706/g.4101  ORF Transcript_2706/g.4101 Transcript_2706/m.4101 type:complete len:459 (+) Transcript_2706:313-1689(+)
MQYTPQEVAEHLVPAFQTAMETIPSEYWPCTPVTYAATAGMRLLTKQDQDTVYDALYQGLTHSTFSLSIIQQTPIHWPFQQMKRSDIFTLGGDEEGLYGMMAANYLSGIVHADLIVKEQEEFLWTHEEGRDDSSTFVGALDMGGSSTQIVFHPGSATSNVAEEQTRYQLNHSEFFSTSYLSYGVDKFRERLWDVLIEEHHLVSNDGNTTTTSIGISNPCLFSGFTTTYEQYTFHGTGMSSDCELLVQRLLPNLDLSHEKDWVSAEREMERIVGGITHPPVRGKFYAMSLYYFALDCLRELAYHEPHQSSLKEQLELEWPNPRLHQLRHAAEGFCARSWTGDLEKIQHNAHQYSRPEILPYRCYESVFMITLLIDGFGFDPHSRDITFAFDVNGQEVEWTLGMALYTYAATQSLSADGRSCSTVNSTKREWSKEKPQLFDSVIGVAYFLDMFGYHHGIS